MKRFFGGAAVRSFKAPHTGPVTLQHVTPQMTISKDSPIQLPPYYESGVDRKPNNPYSIFNLTIRNDPQLKDMRQACFHAADFLNFACSLVKPGVTTDYIDEQLFNYSVHVKKIYPSPLNYNCFPKTLCTSINEVLCHGIPDTRELIEGDIVNLDVSAYFNGFHGDTSRTVYVGDETKLPNEDVRKKLLIAGKEALDESIKAVGPGVDIIKIAQVCDQIATKYGFLVDETFCGHGIGQKFHMLPTIRHTMRAYDSTIQGYKLNAGQVFTIEPIIVAGPTGYLTLDDGWTAVSSSGSLSAQFEHTILITEHGSEVLTTTSKST